MPRPERVIRCQRCGCDVATTAHNRMFCDACYKARLREQERERTRSTRNYSKTAQDKPKPPGTALTIQQTAKMAREAGTTYGAFVAMMEGG